MSPLPLDISYGLNETETDFFKRLTGIESAEKLKELILDTQGEAYEICPYPCIRFFSFACLRMAPHWAYKDVLELGKVLDDRFFLDVGCFMGTDVRKLVADGYPPEKVLATDLRPEFWDMSKYFFKADAQGNLIQFIQGNMMDLSPELLREQKSQTIPPTSLLDLYQRCSAIHLGYVFHLFNEEGQLHLARNVASLLSEKPGSMIFGAHVGLAQAGERLSAMGHPAFGHSPESWKEMWVGEGGIFGEGEVECEAVLSEPGFRDAIIPNSDGKKPLLMKWSIKRL